MKYILIIALFASNISFAQTAKEQAKTYYFKAENAFKEKNYSSSLAYLKKSEAALGKSNSSIEYLRVKNYCELKQYEQAQSALNKFYQYGSSAKLQEMIKPYEQQIKEGRKLNKVLDEIRRNMVYVEGGSFDMGCTSEQSDCRDDEKPVHRVTVGSFYMSKYEVTQAQWEAVMGSNPSKFSDCEACPVEYVSRDDVLKFIARLNANTGKNYRLPTEAEWEYAARGGQKSRGYKYSGSNSISSVAWYEGNSGDKTHPVGEKAANELGLYDMTGNILERCSDWYAKDYYESSSSRDPRGASSSDMDLFRGGSWAYDAENCRVANRIPSPVVRGSFYGFRLVLEP